MNDNADSIIDFLTGVTGADKKPADKDADDFKRLAAQTQATVDRLASQGLKNKSTQAKT